MQDSPRRCPRCSKRLVCEIGQSETAGRELTVEYWCLHDDYREAGPSTAESARRTSPTVRKIAAERLRQQRASGFSRDRGVEVPMVYDTEVADVS